jgi:DNA-binding CsgD family transcriptional regulator
VGCKGGGQDRSDGGRLFDRDAALGRLREMVRMAAAGNGAAVVIRGPPGIGKTALIEVLMRHARDRGFRVLSAQGDETEREFAYGIARRLLEPALLGFDDVDRASLLTGVAAIAAPVVDPASVPAPDPALGPGDPFPLLHGLYRLAAGLAERAPLLIVVDDAHWADRPSLRWLHYLSRRLDGMPALVGIGARTTRPEAPVVEIERLGADAGVTLLEPRPLSEVASEALLRQAFGTAPAPALVQAAHTATSGNPFLLRELARPLVAERIVPDAAAASRFAELTPTAIADDVLRRLAGLGPPARELAAAAAVLAEDAQLRHAAALAGLEEAPALAAADLLVDGGFLCGDGLGRSRLRFVHPLLRQVLEAALAPGERAARHKAAARLLAHEPGGARRAAGHLLEAAPAGDPMVVEVLCRAAAAAVDDGAPDRAAVVLRRALEEPPEEDRATVLLALGHAEAQAGDPRAGDHLLEAARTTRDATQRAEALGWLALMRFHQGDSVAVWTAARAALDQLPPGAGGEAEAWLLMATLWGARPVPELMGEVATMLEQPRLDQGGRTTPAELVRVAFQAHDANLRGRRQEAAAQLARVAEQASGLLGGEQVLLRFMLGVVQAFIDAQGAAEVTLTRVLEHARQRGDRTMMGVLDLLAHLRWRRGDLSGAIAAADTLLALHGQAEPDGWAQPTRWITTIRALCLTDRGDLEAAEAALGLPEELEARQPATWWWAWARFARARLALARRDWPRARQEALAAGERLTRLEICSPHYMEWRSLAAEAMLRTGEHGRARDLVGEELELARREGSPRALGIALRTQGLLQGGTAGIAMLAEAVEELSGASAGLDHARALHELGAALRPANRRVDARAPLQQAVELARGCGAVPLVEHAHAELRIAGARPRRLAFTGAAALTPRERQVAALAADGRSNPEIAQLLFVTRKTVETHLGAVYRKLGLAAREGLAGALGAALPAPDTGPDGAPRDGKPQGASLRRPAEPRA